MNGTLTDVPGIRVGHAHNLEGGITGCTVILCPPNTIGGVDQRGGAPGTRETDLLRPMHLVDKVHGVFLSGGSAYGLAVGDGVMRYLEAQGIGYEARGVRVPIVPGAILFDLDVGDPHIRPDAAMGYTACQAASDNPVAQGSVGAGTGAKVGSILGKDFAVKGGVGSASLDLGDGLVVAALFAVNAAGDVLGEHGQILAGTRQPPEGKQFADSLVVLRKIAPNLLQTGNTVIGVVATNARLTKEEINKVAQMAQDGLARAVRPAHTPFDGDTIFALATGTHPAHVTLVGTFAAEVTAQAIRQGVLQATSLDGIPAIRDLAF
jgi:L-aminopeptidase/D-esterase-like protein